MVQINGKPNLPCADPGGGGQGVQTPEKSQKGFVRSQSYLTVFNVGPSLARQQTPFKWHFVCLQFVARLKCYLDPLSPHQLRNKNFRVGPPLTKLPGSVHASLLSFSLAPIALRMHG